MTLVARGDFPRLWRGWSATRLPQKGIEMAREGVTLAEISYEVAATVFSSDEVSNDVATSRFVSAIDLAQADYLQLLNRWLNDGEFKATHVGSGRPFEPGRDFAEHDSSLWFVDAENASLAFNMLYEKLALHHPSLNTISTYLSEPMRRLRRLLSECGGTYRKSGSFWRFTKIAELVKAEVKEGRKRSSEKTVRADLEKAARHLEGRDQAGQASLFHAANRPTVNAFSGMSAALVKPRGR
jgi:hypothetical protein